MRQIILSLVFVAMMGVWIIENRAAAADPFEQARLYLVKEYVEKEGITNRRVLASMRQTPRHLFVPVSLRKFSYSDQALSIGHLQTISPPFIVAYMTQVLDPQPTDKVLEIGTGSGYQSAILSPLVQDVYSIEIVEPLGKRASATLKRLRYKNIHLKIGDGYKGWAEHAPFDKIIVTCSPESVPAALIEQLKEGGSMIIPIGQRYQQAFYLYKKKQGKLEIEKLEATLFVPMTGLSEDRRKVKPDPSKPSLLNGSFEEDENKDGLVEGWHYQRRVKQVQGNARDGNFYLQFENDNIGQAAHILQGFAIDGRKVKLLNASIDFKLSAWKTDTSIASRPGFIIYYYDQNRRALASQRIGVWEENENWRKSNHRIKVPINAREAIVQIGLNGASGKLAVDHVVLEVVQP